MDHRVVAGGHDKLAVERGLLRLAAFDERRAVEATPARARERKRRRGIAELEARHVLVAADEAAAAALVEQPDRQHVAPFAQKPGGDLVAALALAYLPRVARRPDRNAVHEGVVRVVDPAEEQLRVRGGAGGVELEGAADPHDAVVVLRERERRRDVGPAVALGEILRGGRLADRVNRLRPRLVDLAETRAARLFALRDHAAAHVHGGFQPGDRGGALEREPRLGDGTGVVDLDEPDRDAELAVYLPSEEEADAGEAEGRFERTDLPLRGERIARLGRHGVRDIDQAHVLQPLAGGRDLLLGQGPPHVHLHVRLAGAEPDVAEEDVRDGEHIGTARRVERVRFARGLWREECDPAAVRADRGGRLRDGLARAGEEPDRDGFAGRARSPHGHRAVALQDHMVGEGRRERERRVRGGRHRGDARRRALSHAGVVGRWRGGGKGGDRRNDQCAMRNDERDFHGWSLLDF